MKHIVKYNKLFENNSLKKDYLDILDVIQYVIDDFGILPLPKEAEDIHGMFLEDNMYTTYWGFGVDGAEATSDTKTGGYTSNPLDSNYINMICIWNVHHNDQEKIENALYQELDRMMEISNKPVMIKYEAVADDLGDFCIEISLSLDDVYDNLKESVDLDLDRFKKLNDNQKKEVINLMIKLKSYLS